MTCATRRNPRGRAGVGLVESLVGIAVFLLIATGIYQAFIKLTEAVRVSRIKIAAVALANEQMEIARNLPYASVGLVAGIPSGVLAPTQNLTRSGIPFLVATTVRNIDDPFDGTIGGAPNDLSPADYKLVEISVSCPTCRYFAPVKLTTTTAPKNLETASTNGALFVRVFDANGIPIAGANVSVENASAVPAISINDVTNASGMLQLVDVPPGVGAYQISVSKDGYSSERTYPTGAAGNPNPSKPRATVVLQQVTQVSFAIDLVSRLDISTVTSTCTPVPSVDFSLRGAKLIGTSPDVYKYSQAHATDGSGLLSLPNLEWDSYTLTFTDPAYDLAGAVPILSLGLVPGSTQSFQLAVANKNPNSLMVTVKDAATLLPVTTATATLALGGFSSQLTTGRGFLRQTDWSGGAGQGTYTDVTKYFDSDGHVEISAPTGELKLVSTLGQYAPTGWLESSTFDTGSASNYYQITSTPTDQPPSTGVTPVRIQIATNNDGSTWNFLGPDGSPWTYYTATSTDIHPSHNGNRYLRYRVHLLTDDPLFTPNVSEIAFTFTSSCVPPGQVLYNELSTGTYTLTVGKTGYQTFVNDTVPVAAGWQQTEVLLQPQ